MCQQNEFEHLFGQGIDLDDSMLKCFMTYGFQRGNVPHVHSLKNVQIILDLDATLDPRAHTRATDPGRYESIPLKDKHIIYNRVLRNVSIQSR
mmetsp:Transcript_31428/g.97235  ORF Transcript_31428/g.97235 Transcript_31428/m.97235 type:complete len:93 (-) Transcript_31428:1629-1907(-)